MKKLFLDTDVVMDYLTDRLPFSESITKVIHLTRDKKAELYVSPISFPNLFYIMKKERSRSQIISSFKELAKYVSITEVGKKHIMKSFDSDFSDYEDAVQYSSAEEIKNVSAILTRNKKDFSESDIAVMTPDEYVKAMNVE